MAASAAYCLIGCGSVFDAIAVEPEVYSATAHWELRPAAGVAQLASTAHALLQGIDIATQLFIAVDAQALNYARLELYGLARMAGFKMATLLHPTAWVAPGARLADNVWVGPGVRVSTGSRIGSDVMLNVGARIDSGVEMAAHGWVGPGASLGANVRVGTHSAIGADVHVRAGVSIGRYCHVDQAGPWTRDLRDGYFLEPELTSPARVIGLGYSFKRRT